MRAVYRVFLVLIVLGIGAAAAFLLIWEPAPPNQPIDQTITKEIKP